ncbi:MAG: NAD-dependent epimerase/dehydratase family protein [Deltaproteobacteria bacterium]|nr:MAG: NAD-dependent epimerase/dehydratase family protein [Deltaproteobacteria bacterium]
MSPQKQPRKQTKKRGAIALTGVAGFPGAKLLEALLERNDFDHIVSLDLKRPPIPVTEGKFYKIDLTDPVADAILADILRKEGCEYVVHCAFLSKPIHSSSYAHELEEIGTMHLLNACAQSGVRKIVVRSTTMVYGAHPDNPAYLTESHPLRGDLDYPFIRDKVNVEHLVERFRRRNPDIAVTVLRPCTTLGPTVQNLATLYLDHRVSLTILGHDPLIQLVHEVDVVDAFLRAIEADVEGIFNIAGKGVLPLSAILRVAGNLRLPLRYRSAVRFTDLLWLSQLAPAPSPHLNYLRYPWVADVTAAEERLGFTPHHTTAETIEHYARGLRLKRAL